MNRVKTVTLFFILISLVGGVAVWKLKCDPSQKVRAALADGERLAATEGDPLTACAKYADNMKTFCIEGYFYQAAIHDQSDKSKSLASIMEAEIAKFQIRSSQMRLVWAVAFGLALVKTDRTIVEAREYLEERRPLLFAYVVDGWALELSGKWGAPEAIKKCRAELSKEWWTACDWGAGRGNFFYPKNNADLADSATRAGHEFAKVFTQPGFLEEDGIKRLKEPGARAAYLAKYLYRGSAPEDADLRRMAACMTFRHVTECL